ncbi:MAG: sulfatase-like hydrolase/transferase [Aristaeellaceae bacterium]
MDRDNILLITTDQQRFDTIQALGNSSIYTPHLDYMLTQGTAYTRCYADCPLCVPSRTTLMTGQRGYESGVLTNASHAAVMGQATRERRTLPALLTDAGYQTRAMGKMHFDPVRACYGFESMTLPLDYLRQCERRDNVRPKVHGAMECELVPAISTVDTKDSITTWTVDGSIDFLETRDPLRPFFLWTSFTKPHPPFDPCRDFWELYDGIPMPEAVYGDWSENLDTMPQGFMAGCYENTDVHLFSPRQLANTRRAYYAMITQVDYALGRLFGCLRENGLDRNTWVIFTSDHGEMLGDHHMSQKNLFFEGSAHVPCLILPPKGRGEPVNRRVDTLTELADIFTTILAIAGVPAPEEAHGVDLRRPFAERTFFGNSLNRNFCVMREGYKLVYSACGDQYLLFDMDRDPMERHNLAELPEHARTKEELTRLMLECAARYRPEALENGYFRTIPAPGFPGDVEERWLGFHYHDFSVDVFH